ncbi:MAG: cupin domain-containing protein, partial [Lachnospiraceae bacterium]|nr:cupin domain-containing protein [Lachnospiraceae bacterium]
MDHIDKRGYLNTDYLLFHINDRSKDEHSFHYHEFDKIVVLLSGKASYIIEGREYFLEPGDVLFVNHHDIHKPVIDPDEPYNRIVLWINRDFLTTHSTDD